MAAALAVLALVSIATVPVAARDLDDDALSAALRALGSRSAAVGEEGAADVIDGDYLALVADHAGRTSVVTFDDEGTFSATVEAARDAVNGRELVSLEWNGVVSATSVADPTDDPSWDFLWGHHAVGAPSVWDLGYDGTGVRVAVLDSGVAGGNADIAPQLLDGYNALDPALSNAPDDKPEGEFAAADSWDNTDHGTHVAGTIAAADDNDLGIVGVAHGAQIVPVVVIGTNNSGSTSDIVEGIDWIINQGGSPRADIMNMSFGSYGTSAALQTKIQEAVAAGIVVVAAAGNDGNASAFYPASYPETISVAATEHTSIGGGGGRRLWLPDGARGDYTRASFSNFDATVDVTAPGWLIASLSPTSPSGQVFSGTSMAAPHVAAIAALTLDATGGSLPGTGNTNERFRALLNGAAKDDPSGNGRDDEWGHGLADALGTVSAALGQSAAPFAALSATPGVGTLDLSWTAPSGTAEIEVVVGAQTVATGIDPDEGGVSLSGLGGDATTEVRALDVDGELLDAQLLDTDIATTVPTPVRNLVVTDDASDTTAEVSFDVPAGDGGQRVDSYTIEVNGATAATVAYVDFADSHQSSVTVPAGEVDVTIGVYATSPGGSSSTETVTYRATSAPAAPTAVSLSASGSLPTVSWDAITGFDGLTYTVAYRDRTDSIVTAASGLTVTDYTFTAAQAKEMATSTTPSVFVRGDAAHAGTWGSHSTSLALAPVAEPGLTVTDAGIGRVNVDWDAAGGWGSDVTYEVRIDGQQESTTSTALLVDDLDPATTLDITVTASTVNGSTVVGTTTFTTAAIVLPGAPALGVTVDGTTAFVTATEGTRGNVSITDTELTASPTAQVVETGNLTWEARNLVPGRTYTLTARHRTDRGVAPARTTTFTVPVPRVHQPGVVGPLGPVTINTETGLPELVDTGAPDPTRLVAVSQKADGSGTWATDPEGRMYVTGSAEHLGDLDGLALNQPVLGMTPTNTGEGYWMAAADGGIFAFGDAAFHGSVPGALPDGARLAEPITAMSVTPTGAGYVLVASDGGVFTFGDAAFHGSIPGVLAPGQSLVSPINGLAVTPTGEGYWMVAADGGVFGFGDATFHGGLGGTPLDAPIVGMIATDTGDGYWLIDATGRAFPFGDAE